MRRSLPVVDAGLFLVIFLVPLAWTNFVSAEFTLPKFLALNAALALAAWGAAWRPTALASGRTALDLPILAGLFILGLASAASTDPSTSLLGRYNSYAYGLWGFSLLAAAYQLAARSARSHEAARAGWLVWAAAIVGGYGILQKLGFDPLLQVYRLPEGRRAISTIGSPVDLGALLALVWPRSLWRFDARRKPAPAIAAVLIAGGLVASASRGAWLAAAVGAAAYWLLRRRDPGTSLRPSLAATVAAVAAAVAWSFRPAASISDVARREVWKTALLAFAKRPLLGWGPDGFEDAFRLLRTDGFVAVMGSGRHQAYPHNDILQVLAGSGLAGAAAFAWLLWMLARTARRALEAPETRMLAASLLAGLLALWVNLKLNPLSSEVLAFAAVEAGLLVSLIGVEGKAPLRRAPLLAVAAGLTVSTLYCLGMTGADMMFKAAVQAQGARDFPAAKALFTAARQSAPCELTYILGEVNAASDWLNATNDAKDRLAVLALVEADGRQAVACHPRQVNARYAAGVAASMHADLGFKDHLVISARELDEALLLDPKFAPLIQSRLKIARLMGDAPLVSELERLPAASPR